MRRSERGFRTGLRDGWTLGLCAWLLVLAVAGSGPWSVMEAMLCTVALALAAAALARAVLKTRGALPQWAWIWGAGVLLACALHLVPLPWDLWSALGVRADHVGALRLAGVDGGWRPFTLDPDTGFASAYALAVPASVWALFHIRGDRGVHVLLATLVLVAVGGAVIGLAQWLLHLELPWLHGRSAGAATGWFLNRNLFAAQQAAAIVIAVHLALRPGPQAGRWAWWIAVAMLLAALIGSQSRAGIVVGILGLLGSFGLNAGPRFGRVMRSGLAVAVLALGTLVAWLVADQSGRVGWGIWQEQLAPGGRLALWTQLPPLDAWGVGLGGFAQWYQASPGAMVTDAVVHHLHNDWLELAIELGLLFPVLAFSGLVGGMRAMRRARQQGYGATAAACVAALGCLLALSVVDTPLRASTNLATFALLAAIVLQLGRHRSPTSKTARIP